MKKTTLIFLFSIVLTFVCSAQQKSNEVMSSSYFKPVAEKKDSVNISEIIQSQVAAAQLKEVNEKNSVQQVVKPVAKPVAKPETKPVAKAVKSSEKLDQASMPVGIFLFVVGSLVIFYFLIFRKKMFERKSKAALKNNIKMLREEKLMVRTKERKNNPRPKLVDDTAHMNPKGMVISQMAKELKVSQGEILLAARIKSYEMARVCSSK